MTEWIVHPPHRSRSLEWTARDSRCGRFSLISKIHPMTKNLHWVLVVGDVPHSSHPSLHMVEIAIQKIQAQEAAQ